MCCNLRYLGFLNVLLFVAVLPIVLADKEPQPPQLPDSFVAEGRLVDERNKTLAKGVLYYDWKSQKLRIDKHNKNRDSSFWEFIVDYELHKMYALVSTREHVECVISSFTQRMVPPTFLQDADYIGVETVNDVTCNHWKKSGWIDFWESVAGNKPIAYESQRDGRFIIDDFRGGPINPDTFNIPPNVKCKHTSEERVK
jgi:hypothetical protein